MHLWQMRNHSKEDKQGDLGGEIVGRETVSSSESHAPGAILTPTAYLPVWHFMQICTCLAQISPLSKEAWRTPWREIVGK